MFEEGEEEAGPDERGVVGGASSVGVGWVLLVLEFEEARSVKEALDTAVDSVVGSEDGCEVAETAGVVLGGIAL